MQANGMTGRLAAFSSRRPWLVIGVWLVVFVATIGVTVGFPATMTTNAEFTNRPEALRASELLDERMGDDDTPTPTEYVIVASDDLTIDDPAFRSFVETLTGEISSLSGYVDLVANFYLTGDERLVADDRKATVLPVFIAEDATGTDRYLDLIDERDGTEGFTVVSGGDESIEAAFVETAEADLVTGETIGVSVAILVLIVVFGTLVAAGVPVALAIVAIATAMGITTITGHLFELSIFVINMLIMIGLAVGIDYSLFIVGRYREERARGLDTQAAVIRTGDTASKAVLFSGLTVVTALLGMLLVPSTIFKSLGAGAIFVTIVAILATLTLLPAGLSLIGDGIDRGRKRTLMAVLGVMLLLFSWLFTIVDAGQAFTIGYIVLAIGCFVLAGLGIDPFHRRETGGDSVFWNRLTAVVMRRAVVLVISSTMLLAAAASAYFTIELGESGISTLPRETTAYRAFSLLSTRFSAISLESPHRVVIDGDLNAPEVQAGIDRLTQLLATDDAFGQPWLEVNDSGDLGVLNVPAVNDTRSTASIDSIRRLRADHVPEAFHDTDAEVLVGGPTAFTLDFIGTVNDYTPIVFAFVLGVSFLLLMLAFRSIVVPLKSVLMNLLSVGASYGLLVLVFQHGYGNEIFGFQQVERIDAWVPLMMFSILFGLSMDYHVFLLSRIREHYDHTHDNSASVAYGLRTTASMITGAALIMVAVFGGFAMGELTMFQQIGFGLAVAVIIDATIIRSILVPAAMELLGDLNWYFPSWLEWLPKLNVEGIPEADGRESVPAD